MNNMSRDYGAQFDFLEGEPVGRALDCLGPRQAAGPFHYLINEQAKSLLALQELQNEVGALLEFRDLVIETFPSLKTKLSSPTASTSHGSSGPVLVRTDWVPGVRVRRKLAAKKNDAVPDSGFSTETSSKDTHSASSSAMTNPSAGTADETDDELWSLLDVIHRKGTRLKDEVETLQGQLQQRSPSDEDFRRHSPDDSRRRERDSLISRLAEMEAEVVASRIQMSRLQDDLEQLLMTKLDLEEQLRAVLNQRGEVNSRIHDLHSQFVTKSAAAAAGGVTLEKLKAPPPIDNSRTNNDETKSSRNGSVDLASSQRGESRIGTAIISDGKSDAENSENDNDDNVAVLDRVLGAKIPKVKVTDSKKFNAILSELNPTVLQKHLLTSTVQNEILLRQLESASRLEVNLVDKLDKVKEENEELKFQLEDKNIELEGTRARVRMLEQIQKGPSFSGPDVIPTSTLSGSPPSRAEILSSSMKNMRPIPMNLQTDHCSSTESAQDQTESNRKNVENARRRPSKIPLKSYTAPKPPGRGKSYTSAPARSRSGDSPGRPHSAQSTRATSKNGEADSLQGSASKGASLPKSRNGSLVTSKDSLSSKLRSTDSMSKLSSSAANSNSFGGGGGGSSTRATLRKNSSPTIKWTTSGAGSNSGNGKEQATADKINSSPISREKFQYQWSPYSFELVDAANFPDSLDLNSSSTQHSITEDSSSRKFQTASASTWNHSSSGKIKEYYDSIDSNLFSSLYQQNGEQLAERDSLENRDSKSLTENGLNQ